MTVVKILYSKFIKFLNRHLTKSDFRQRWNYNLHILYKKNNFYLTLIQNFEACGGFLFNKKSIRIESRWMFVNISFKKTETTHQYLRTVARSQFPFRKALHYLLAAIFGALSLEIGTACITVYEFYYAFRAIDSPLMNSEKLSLFGG